MGSQKDYVSSVQPLAETLTAKVRVRESAASFRRVTDAFMALTPTGVLTIDTLDKAVTTPSQILRTNVQSITKVSAHSTGIALTIEGRTYFIAFSHYIHPVLYLLLNPTLLWLFSQRRKSAAGEKERWLNAFKNFQISVDIATKENTRAIAIAGLSIFFGLLAVIIAVGFMLLHSL